MHISAFRRATAVGSLTLTLVIAATAALAQAPAPAKPVAVIAINSVGPTLRQHQLAFVSAA